MKWGIVWGRTKRVARRTLPYAYRDFRDTLIKRDRVFDGALAILVSYIGLQTASLPKLVEETTAWINFLQAFFYVTVGWAAICLLRAPFLVAAEDRAKGDWIGNRFVYKQPLLVATLRCKPTGETEMYKVRFSDAEPGAFVDYTIELDGAKNLAEIGLGGVAIAGPIPFKNWPGTGGALLPANRIAIFQMRLPPNAVATTARIYCRSFTIGEPNDQDGWVGNHQFPVRPALDGDGAGRST